MATPSLDDIHARLELLLHGDETLQHWAYGRSKPKFNIGLLLLLPVVLWIAFQVAGFVAIGALHLGLEAGIATVVGGLLTILILRPYFYALLKSDLRCAVGLTDKRVLIVDVGEGQNSQPPREIFLADPSSLSVRAGLSPLLTVREPDNVLKIVFPKTPSGNEGQTAAILQRLAGS